MHDYVMRYENINCIMLLLDPTLLQSPEGAEKLLRLARIK